MFLFLNINLKSFVMKNRNHLSLVEKIGYSLGDFASVLFWQTISLHLLFYYTDVFGITASAAGTMILFSRIWDGINDPLMGIIADRTNTRWGKYRPYLIWMSLPLYILAILTFTTPNFSYFGKLIYAYVTFILFMMAYTAINIPYSTMLGVLTPDTRERTVLSSFKYIGAYAGGLVISAFFLPMVKYFGGSGSSPKGWTLSISILGAIAVLLFFITFLLTKERVYPPKSQKTTIKGDLKDLFSNKPWIILLFTTLLMILFVSLRLGITNYYFKYYLSPENFEKNVSVFNTVGMIASIAGVLCVSFFAKILGKKKTFIILFLLSIIFTATFYLLKPGDIKKALILQFFGSLTGGPLTPLIWAMYADTADYAEWKNFRRATGLIFSASTMSQKIGWAIGNAITGWLLRVIGYIPNIEQSDEVIKGIRLIMSLLPSIAGILAILCVLSYNLDDKKMLRIQEELSERRKLTN